MLILWSLDRSRIGTLWRAVGEDEIAAQSAGISLTAAKVSAFGIGGAIAGLAGGLFSHNTTHIEHGNFSILLATFAIVSVATMAFAGVGTADKPTSLVNSDDVFSSIGSQVLGGGFDKFLIFAILSSAAASTQTTILPTSRAVLSMAAYEALPAKFARTHPRFLTPTWATVATGGVSIVFYVGLAAISNNILADAASAVGLLIAFYYGLTGFAAAWYFKNDRGDTIKDFAVRVVMPFLGGAILLWAFIETLVAKEFRAPGRARARSARRSAAT